jgi:hypothetical protein
LRTHGIVLKPGVRLKRGVVLMCGVVLKREPTPKTLAPHQALSQ